MGDLLTFAPRPASKLAGPRFGFRRGTSATGWYELGCRLETSDSHAAIAAYERALAGCPTLADAHNNLGRLHHDVGSLGVAEGAYRLAICADPSVALYWFNLGVAVEDQGRSAEAIAAYERALELDGTTADAHYNLARLLEVSGRRMQDIPAQRTAGWQLLQQAVRHLLRYRALTGRRAAAR
ncbi:MAG: tetratricopeptide repeat protein [Myxococcales bacterium]|nr:tetratricopeptide repeat protein [Myxococcales bacterium]